MTVSAQEYGEVSRNAVRSSPLAARRRRRPARGGSRKSRRRNLRKALLFLSPWLAGLVVLQGYPLVMTAYYSFTDFDGLNFPPHWVGFRNFETLLTADPQFWPSVRNTIWWVGLSVPLTIVLGIGLAVLLNQRVRGIGFFRTAFYLPSMVPFVGGSILFVYLFNPSGGPIDSALATLGLPQPGWFTDPTWARPTLLLLSLWQVGSAMVIFLAGLQDIPQELYDAAAMDGARGVRRFWHITLPLLTPAIFFNLLLGTIYGFSFFTQALVTSSAPGGVGGAGAVGGPVDSTLFYSLYLYTQIFTRFQFGIGAAMSLMLTLVVVIVAAILFKTSKRWVFYYGD